MITQYEVFKKNFKGCIGGLTLERTFKIKMDDEKIVWSDVEKEILSKEQLDICDMCNMNAKNDEIIEKHRLSGNASYTTAEFETYKRQCMSVFQDQINLYIKDVKLEQ